MAVRGKVLIVEDDRAICSFMRRVLEANGYESIIVGTGREALSMLTSHCPDVVILDLGLPDMDGMDVLTQLRAWSLMPVVVVSARTDEREKVRALDAGADDYITKPFGTSELLARLRTAIRHTRTTSGNASIAKENRFTARGLVIDYDKYRVYIDGRDAGLTQNEFKLVALLIAYLRGMNDELNIPHAIGHYGADSYPCEQGFVPESVFLERLPEIARNAIADACTGSNPRQPSQEEMEKLLKCCYYDTEVDF